MGLNYLRKILKKMSLKNNISKAKQDPTNQGLVRRNANRDNVRRLNSAYREVNKLWKDLVTPKRLTVKPIINQSDVYYDYNDLSAIELATFSATVLSILESALETSTEQKPVNWYFEDYTSRAYTNGVAQESMLLDSLFEGIALSPLFGIDPNQTSPFINPIQTLPIRMQESFQKLAWSQYSSFRDVSTSTTNQIIQEITRGMDKGLSKSQITKLIVERFEVSKSRAKRITDTEVNKSYNNARLDTTLEYRAQGVEVAVMHVSALLPTTRQGHAERHGNVYTPEQQRGWWDTGVNRINCHCSIRSVRVNKQGKVQNVRQQQRMRKEGKEFFKSK